MYTWPSSCLMCIWRAFSPCPCEFVSMCEKKLCVLDVCFVQRSKSKLSDVEYGFGSFSRSVSNGLTLLVASEDHDRGRRSQEHDRMRWRVWVTTVTREYVLNDILGACQQVRANNCSLCVYIAKTETDCCFERNVYSRTAMYWRNEQLRLHLRYRAEKRDT